MANLILPRGSRPAERPRINRDNTITLPFDTGSGQVNITFTRAGYQRFVDTCEDLWARIRRAQAVADTISEIERHESVV